MAVSLVEAQVELEELASGSVFKNCDRHRDFIVFHRANLLLDWHVDGLDWNLVLRHGLVETEVEVLLPVPVSVVLDLDIVVDDSTAGALQHGVRVAHDLSTLHHVLRLALLVRSVSSIVLVVLAMLEASFVVQEVLNFFLAETVVAAEVADPVLPELLLLAFVSLVQNIETFSLLVVLPLSFGLSPNVLHFFPVGVGGAARFGLSGGRRLLFLFFVDFGDYFVREATAHSLNLLALSLLRLLGLCLFKLDIVVVNRHFPLLALVNQLIEDVGVRVQKFLSDEVLNVVTGNALVLSAGLGHSTRVMHVIRQFNLDTEFTSSLGGCSCSHQSSIVCNFNPLLASILVHDAHLVLLEGLGDTCVLAHSLAGLEQRPEVCNVKFLGDWLAICQLQAGSDGEVFGSRFVHFESRSCCL
jgi:hypothetical protein